jgi:hypothetical protein
VGPSCHRLQKRENRGFPRATVAHSPAARRYSAGVADWPGRERVKWGFDWRWWPTRWWPAASSPRRPAVGHGEATASKREEGRGREEKEGKASRDLEDAQGGATWARRGRNRARDGDPGAKQRSGGGRSAAAAETWRGRAARQGGRKEEAVGGPTLWRAAGIGGWTARSTLATTMAMAALFWRRKRSKRWR